MKIKRTIPTNLLLFLLLFYFSMGISKYIQVLGFNENDALFNYSLSYAAMAIAGSLSFLISSFISEWPVNKILAYFIPFYAVGMSLRVITDSVFIALLSGSIAGLGASICILAIRSQLYYLSDEQPENKEKIISIRYTVMQISLTAATFIAGQLIFIMHMKNKYMYLLLASAVVLLVVLLMKGAPNHRISSKRTKKRWRAPKRKGCILNLYVSVLLLGGSTSLLEPLIPVFISDVGYNAAIAAIIYSSYGIFKVGAIFIFRLRLFSGNAAVTFILLETVSGTLVVTLGNIGVNQQLVIFLLFITGLETVGFFVMKEIMEYQMLPKQELLLYLGIIQSAFLFGDALGSVLGSTLYNTFGINELIQTFGVLTFSSSLYYFTLYLYIRNVIGR